MLFLAVLAFALPASSQDFEEFFEPRTLRVDYVFASSDGVRAVYVDQLHSYPYWAGRRVNLDSVPVEGNGSLEMKDLESGRVIYRTSFSSLFSEWCNEQDISLISPQNAGEAVQPRSNASFEHVVNLPMPKAKTEITLTLTDKYRKPMASQTFVFDPRDILVRAHSSKASSPVRYVDPRSCRLSENAAGPIEERIDVAIVAEGYTAGEMDVFYKDAEATVKALMSHEPFKTYRDRFNFIAVGCPSEDSGVSEPAKGEWKSTAAGSNYSTFYVDRYLTTMKVKQLNDVLSGIPFEHIIILANTSTYGGGGIYNSYTLTTAHNALFKPVVVHEFGHSFGALADEYSYTDAPSDTYPYEIEPWEKNITTKVDFSSKWEDMMQQKGVGLVEGAGYTNKGIYRACRTCRMLNNTAPGFCPVCQRAVEEMILYYTE